MGLLLHEILDELEFEWLLEEGRDPVEILHYKYKNIPNEIINKVISIDPTKKKSYSQWLLSKWNDEKDVILQNLKNGRIAKLFQHYKNHQDIQIKDCPSVEEGLNNFVPKEDTVLVKSSEPETYVKNLGEYVDSELANDFDIVFNEDNWIIAVPNTYEAECKLGENMRWCTANAFGDGLSYYKRYLNEYGGKYYVNFDMSKGESCKGKDYPFTRYQFHFESNQFMDKNDDPIDLSEIGMPGNVIDFYDDEGYDVSEYENNEARYERYLEERGNSYYKINDEMYLNIEWDNDYRYYEPDESTSFYLFSSNDDIDPVIWTEIPNPFYNNVVLLNIDYINVIKAVGDTVVITYPMTNYYVDAVEVSEYLILPYNYGVFYFDSGNYHFVLDSQDESHKVVDEFTVNSLDNVFINQNCSETDKYNRVFVEAVSNGVHSLFATDGKDVDIIVFKDVPYNGDSFTISENGLVYGKYRKYKAYDEAEYESEEDNVEYSVEEKLKNGDYLVFKSVYNDYNQKVIKYNILNSNTKKILSEIWFDNFKGIAENTYYIQIKEGEYTKEAFIRIDNGKLIGGWYDSIYILDGKNKIICGINNEEQYNDIIDCSKCDVIYTVRYIITDRTSTVFSNIIAVVTMDDAKIMFLDYINREFKFTQLENVISIDRRMYPSLFLCNVNGEDGKSIFDLDSQTILVNNIRDVNKGPRGIISILRLYKTNGKVNMFSSRNKKEIIPYDVEDITDINTERGVVSYQLNNRNYLYDYTDNKYIVNGIPFDIELKGYNYFNIYNGNYTMSCVLNNNGTCSFALWREGRSVSGEGHTDINNAPKEVMDMYNYINYVGESIIYNFRKYLNMINEIRKLYR